jgi:hypothetical protein
MDTTKSHAVNDRSVNDRTNERTIASYTPEELAERAYQAYCANLGNVDRNQQRTLPWQNLPGSERAAWMAAIHVTTTHLNTVYGHDPLDAHHERERELRGESPRAAQAAERNAAAANANADEDATTNEKNGRVRAHSAR